jgi:hypothetical protein
MEWACKLTDAGIQILQGKNAYCQTVLDVDEGFNQADMKDPKRPRR